MQIYDKIGAQGDILFKRVDPKVLEQPGVKLAKDNVVAHSESGHHHIARRRPGFEVERFEVDGNQMQSFLRIRRTGEQVMAGADQALASIDEALASVGCEVVHEKAGPDAHETSGLACEGEEAVYQALRQREQRPEGWVAVAD